jgi:hypothetical protein
LIIMGFECSAGRPWGIHPIVRNDEDCQRCGWTAPGPRGDAVADAFAAAEEAFAIASVRGWMADAAGQAPDEGQSLAA